MNLSNLTPTKGSVKNRKRIGRGNATGQGRTAGKGHKGYKSRSGASNRFHFEGGQTPMARRIPKRGLGTGKFNHMQTKDLVQAVNLDRIFADPLTDIIPPNVPPPPNPRPSLSEPCNKTNITKNNASIN